jgi:hypothetical protein
MCQAYEMGDCSFQWKRKEQYGGEQAEKELSFPQLYAYVCV